jgi:hypothetical protein
MEIISKINTENGMEIKIRLNGKVLEKTFSYEELDAFVRKERKEEMKRNRSDSTSEHIQPSIKRQRN